MLDSSISSGSCPMVICPSPEMSIVLRWRVIWGKHGHVLYRQLRIRRHTANKGSSIMSASIRRDTIGP